jgi:hypothetical protein
LKLLPANFSELYIALEPNINLHFLPSVIKINLKFVQAYESLTDGLGRTASALIGNPIKVYNRGGGPGSVLTTAICATPVAVVAPVSAFARAIHRVLLGARNR